MTGEVDESETICQLLTDFYLSTAEENKTHDVPLFADQQLEKQNGAYISANTCQSCHEQEYLQWSATRHAFAYQTLVKKERYFDPNCVSCHTTGFGYTTGFQIGDQDSILKGAQCETCHGPGKQHAGNPKKTNIRKGKYQEELILAVILACPIIGILLLFGLGLSDTTYQGVSSDHIMRTTTEISKINKATLHAGHSEVANRHATNACQMRRNHS